MTYSQAKATAYDYRVSAPSVLREAAAVLCARFEATPEDVQDAAHCLERAQCHPINTMSDAELARRLKFHEEDITCETLYQENIRQFWMQELGYEIQRRAERKTALEQAVEIAIDQYREMGNSVPTSVLAKRLKITESEVEAAKDRLKAKGKLSANG